jgi:nitrogen-specific signal transduction histidine kinase
LFSPKTIKVFTDFDSSLQPVKTKALVIKQILVNLLKNAAEALDKNGRILLTTCGYSTADGRHYVDIRIQDDGPGIAKEIKERLFSPVISTKGEGHAGLGLSIVKGMVDDIGANISCHSSAEFGTSFNLVIPALAE